MFGKLYRHLKSHREKWNNPQVTNGGRQRKQQAQQQDQCEPPQERQPKGNKIAVQLEVQNDTLDGKCRPNIAPLITTAVDVVYSPSFAKAQPPIVSLEEIGDVASHRIALGVIRLPGTNDVLKYSRFAKLVETETLVMLAESFCVSLSREPINAYALRFYHIVVFHNPSH
ncbi:hypothetical protein EMCG_03692 [[Emmonsia] crescens]|uniref:Uncharacterized protein n=1 Tax=[Emmonsia] crescens TaxID=73230 RepID=A0A0G2HUE4_9EURO|nr:hypothetical protein EMCG_03692 [Emmonsia crescens UAMH 3008]